MVDFLIEHIGGVTRPVDVILEEGSQSYAFARIDATQSWDEIHVTRGLLERRRRSEILAVILHEYRHLHDDNQKLKTLYSSRKKGLQKCEFDADEFVAIHGFGRELISLLEHRYYEVNKVELMKKPGPRHPSVLARAGRIQGILGGVYEEAG